MQAASHDSWHDIPRRGLLQNGMPRPVLSRFRTPFKEDRDITACGSLELREVVTRSQQHAAMSGGCLAQGRKDFKGARWFMLVMDPERVYPHLCHSGAHLYSLMGGSHLLKRS